MRITVLGAAGGETPESSLVSFLIGDNMLLDAGSVGLRLGLEQQRKIRHVFLTHAHLDHIHALPFLLDNLIGRIEEPVTVYGLPEVLTALHKNIFNNAIWPDFSVLPTPQAPVMRFQPMVPLQAITVENLRIELLPVNHSFAAGAYLISDQRGTVVFTGDTGRDSGMWDRVKDMDVIRAVFMECSFPNRMLSLAEKSKHLTPSGVENELAQLDPRRPLRVFLYHLKPEYIREIGQEAKKITRTKVRLAKHGEQYNF